MQTSHPAMMTPELNQAMNMVALPGTVQQQQQSVSPRSLMSDMGSQLAMLQQQQLISSGTYCLEWLQ